MKTIAVFFGGKSVEHDVSVITGVMTLNSINKEKYNAIPIYVTRSGEWVTGELLKDIDEYKNLETKKLKKVSLFCGDNILYEIKGKKVKPIERISVAINCMHGASGEDGSLSGVMNMCNIAFASPGVLSSAVSMDKIFTKTVMKGLGVRTLAYFSIKDKVSALEKKDQIEYPVIIKPYKLGSSIGISIAKDAEQFVGAVDFALRYGEKVIVEPCLSDFTEINCAVYRCGDDICVSECERPIGRTEILSFGDKYESGKREFPALIDNKLSYKIKEISKKVYEELGFFGVIRIDYFIKDNRIYLNEINSVPGSLAYYFFCETLKSFTDMLDGIIDDALKNHSQSCTIKTDYKSNILCGGGIKGAKKQAKS